VVTVHEQEDELIDQITQAEAQRLAHHLAHNGPAWLNRPGGVLLAEQFSAWWLGPDGVAVPSAVPAHLQTLSDGPHHDVLRGRAWHAVVLPVLGGRLFVQYDAQVNEAKVHDYAALALGLAVLMVGLATPLALHLASAVVAPIECVTQQLDRWAPSAAEVGEAGAGGREVVDEDQRLLAAFDRVQARLEQMLAHERMAWADLRHELRTPLTALRTDLEMLTVTSGDEAARHPRLQRALTAVDAVAGALDAVRPRHVASEHPPQSVNLARCVQDAWDSLGDLPSRHALTLCNDIDAAAHVTADRHALLTLLRNLMRNAAEHAAPAQCRVWRSPDGVVFEDDGPGVPGHELALLFERSWRGRLADHPASEPADARGLGLAIARQMAELQGWRLHAEAVEPHGLRFVLTLAEHHGFSTARSLASRLLA
jgi:signal transduction histidine kinase